MQTDQMALPVSQVLQAKTVSQVLLVRTVLHLFSKLRMTTGLFHMTMDRHGASLARLPVRTARMERQVLRVRMESQVRTEPTVRMARTAIRSSRV